MPRIRQRKPEEVDAAYAAAQRVVETHKRLAEFLRVGQTVAEIDRFVGETLESLDCKSCFLGYRIPRLPAFPSHACLSVNDCIVHGTATSYTDPMKEGDLLKIDIGVSYRGWIGDAAWTYAFKEVDERTRRLMTCGQETLRRGIEQLQPGEPLIEWARAVQSHAEGECGFHLIRGLGGHGYGRKLHDRPFISNVVPTYAGEWQDAMTRCEPGMLLAVEPMIATGTYHTTQPPGKWPISTADGSMSVHYEHDVLITPEGPRVLTEGLDDLPDIIES